MASIPGFVMGVVVMVTVREPERREKEVRERERERVSEIAESERDHHNFVQVTAAKKRSLLWTILQSYLQLPLILLCVGGGLRRGGLLVWVYNAKAYFQTYYCDTLWVGVFLSWVPLVGGSLGAVLGGVVSDRLAKRWGGMTRPYVLILSQVRERGRE